MQPSKSTKKQVERRLPTWQPSLNPSVQLSSAFQKHCRPSTSVQHPSRPVLSSEQSTQTYEKVGVCVCALVKSWSASSNNTPHILPYRHHRARRPWNRPSFQQARFSAPCARVPVSLSTPASRRKGQHTIKARRRRQRRRRKIIWRDFRTPLAKIATLVRHPSFCVLCWWVGLQVHSTGTIYSSTYFGRHTRLPSQVHASLNNTSSLTAASQAYKTYKYYIVLQAPSPAHHFLFFPTAPSTTARFCDNQQKQPSFSGSALFAVHCPTVPLYLLLPL